MVLSAAYDILRWSHLVAGCFAFALAPLILLRRKGSPSHRLMGRLYLYPMSFAAASAAVLAAWKDNTTFVFIGLFSLYLGISGLRALAFKPGHVARPIDQVIPAAALVFFVVMLLFAGVQLTRGAIPAIPLVAFGIVGLVLAASDLSRLRASRSPHSWFFGHMTGMAASYIAAVSAFSVVNLSFLPLPVRILWPAAVGIPLLAMVQRRWQRRLMSWPLPVEVELPG